MHIKLLAGLCLSLTCLGGALRADEVRLADGRVLVGKVARHGAFLEVTTRDGVVRVRADRVLSIRTEKDLRAALRALAKGRKDDAFTHLQLGRLAFSYGLTREMWRHLDRCLECLQQKADAAIHGRLTQLLVTLEPELLPARVRQQSIRTRVRALVRRARPSAGAARRAAISELLVREPDANRALLETARTEPLAEQRLVAIAALQRRAPKAHESFVLLRTILDKDSRVRAGTADLIRAAGDAKRAVQRLAPGLMHDLPTVRMRTAAAYARLGDKAAAPLLVAAGPLAGVPAAVAAGAPGGSTRAHMFQTTQRAYVRDFDVEIAQAAAVANPVIGNVSDGVALDVTVAAVVTHRRRIEKAYRRALEKLVGSDPGPDPRIWAAWLARQGGRQARSPSGR